MGKECAICFEVFDKNNEIAVIDDCSHIFHFACLYKWSTITEADDVTCPLCRTVIHEEVTLVTFEDIDCSNSDEEDEKNEDIDNNEIASESGSNQHIQFVSEKPGHPDSMDWTNDFDIDRNGTVYIDVPVPYWLKRD